MNESLCCNCDETLLDAIQAINDNAKGMVFVIDHERKLCGVLTDGDIRRLILEGCPLQNKISRVVKKDFVYSRDDEEISSRMAKLKGPIKFLPIVDKDFRLVDYMELKHDVYVPVMAPNLHGNELKYLIEAFLSSWISSSGQYISDFENGFAKFCQCPYAVATSNGTTALHLALMACGIGPGDEVIVPDLTFAATINVVLHAGATPVIVDVERESWCIDPSEIEKALTARTKAVIPVHLYGQPCDMDKIMDIARRKKLYVIEDCAEAHGALYKSQPVGGFGDVGCFSFFGNKVMTTGEGGMCVTRSEELNERMRILRDHGMSRTKKYWHDVVGFNYRMTNLQAAIGCAQLERVGETLKNRAAVEAAYLRELGGFSFLEFQRFLPHRHKITWLVTALLKGFDREQCIVLLKQRGIDVRPMFYSLSLMPLYSPYTFSSRISREISQQGLSFPTADIISGEIILRVKEALQCLSDVD